MTITSAPAEQIAAFYACHAERPRRIVAANVHAPEQTTEDACQSAWAILLRRNDVTLDHGGFAWLTTVAIREAWRLASRAREVPIGAYLPADPEPGIVPEPPANTTDPADRAIAREQHAQRVNDLARLKPREREALYLKALGHSYYEIAALTNASYTAVNRRINEGRARLRKLARERHAPTGAGGEEGAKTRRGAPNQDTMDIQPITSRRRPSRAGRGGSGAACP